MSALLLLAAAAVPVNLQCTLALVMPGGQFTDSTPVTISFTGVGKAMQDIHVVDDGGILYPGGNMQMTHTADAVSLGAVPFPTERPGAWTGKIEKKMYRLTLNNGSNERVEIGIGRIPVGTTNRLGLTWTASHQPAGMPQPLAGQGVGQCPQPIGIAQ